MLQGRAHAADAVDVVLGAVRQRHVDHARQPGHVQPARGHVRRDQEAHRALAERLHAQARACRCAGHQAKQGRAAGRCLASCKPPVIGLCQQTCAPCLIDRLGVPGALASAQHGIGQAKDVRRIAEFQTRRQCAQPATDEFGKGSTLPRARAALLSARTCSAARRCSMARAPPSTAQE